MEVTKEERKTVWLFKCNNQEEADKNLDMLRFFSNDIVCMLKEVGVNMDGVNILVHQRNDAFAVEVIKEVA